MKEQGFAILVALLVVGCDREPTESSAELCEVGSTGTDVPEPTDEELAQACHDGMDCVLTHCAPHLEVLDEVCDPELGFVNCPERMDYDVCVELCGAVRAFLPRHYTDAWNGRQPEHEEIDGCGLTGSVRGDLCARWGDQCAEHRARCDAAEC